MTRWRWILVAQLAALPLVALALWLHGREQAVPQGSAVHEPAPAATIQPIPSEEPLPAQPVVAWTPKDDFDPMHVQNLDVVNPARTIYIMRSLKRFVGPRVGPELDVSIGEIWQAYNLGDAERVEAVLKEESEAVRLDSRVVGVNENGVLLKDIVGGGTICVVMPRDDQSGSLGSYSFGGVPYRRRADNGAAPMPFGRHPFGPWDIGRDNPDG